MKYSEMNAHERLAFERVCNVMSEYIGGSENMLEDYPEDSEEYAIAKRHLSKPHDEMIDEIYREVMMDSNRDVLKHLRFAGEAFIRERISKRLTKWGY